jgi:hypothetical protein
VGFWGDIATHWDLAVRGVLVMRMLGKAIAHPRFLSYFSGIVWEHPST